VKAVRVPRALLREVVAGLPAADRAETAVAAYCHPNPLVRWVFWQRLDTALALAALAPREAVLDYGIGSGVLLASLRPLCGVLVGTDLHLEPARAMAARVGGDVELVPLERFPVWAEGQRGRFACIFALDVLEHVEEAELPARSTDFQALLAPGGRLIVSGPTESFMYRLARRVAGFHNAYHHRSIFDIERVLEKRWRAEQRVRVPAPPLPHAFDVTRYVSAGW